MANILEKITYTTLQDFVDKINRNFAVIQNSPLYKGIPGNPGVPGNVGNPGIRGSQFLFVSVTKFASIFPTEIYAGSHVTQDFINDKLLSDEVKLLECFGVNEFVNNDIVVLTSSVMLSYEFLQDRFVNTNLAFNAQANFVSQIETQIETYVQYYIDNNPILNSIEDIFDSFVTIAKNYPDVNNTEIVGATSIYVPFYPPLTNDNGVTMDNHKYFGFSDNMFPQTNDGTFVIGSIKKYISLLTNTYSPEQANTYTSDYAPGVGNIPALIILQDTVRNGIMIGKKTDSNLKKFSGIYKNADDDLVLQSEQGPEPAPGEQTVFSRLLISNLRMRYDKHAMFGSVDITTNLTVNGHYDGNFIRSGTFTTSENAIDLEIGSNATGARTYHSADNQRFTKFPLCFLYTDNEGEVQKDITFDTTTLDANLLPGLKAITVVPSDSKKIITSHHANYIIQKINNISSYVNNLFYDSNEFTDNSIPGLSLNTVLQVGADLSNPNFYADNTEVILGKDQNSTNTINGFLKLGKYISRVIVTNAAGLVLDTYKLDDTIYNPAEIATNVQLTLLTQEAGNTKVLTETYGNQIIKKINTFMGFVNSTYLTETSLETLTWTKPEWETGVIPKLVLRDNLRVINNTNNGTVFEVLANGVDFYKINLGYDENNVLIQQGGAFVYKRALNMVEPYPMVSANSQGANNPNYGIDTVVYPDSESDGYALATVYMPEETPTGGKLALQNRLPTLSIIRYIFTRLNAISKTLVADLKTTNYWIYSQGNLGHAIILAVPSGHIDNISQQSSISKNGKIVTISFSVRTSNYVLSHSWYNIGTLAASLRPIPGQTHYGTAVMKNPGDDDFVFEEAGQFAITASGIVYVSTSIAGRIQSLSFTVSYLTL